MDRLFVRQSTSNIKQLDPRSEVLRRREELLQMMQRRIDQEFKDQDEVPNIVTIDTHSEMKYKGLIDELRNLNNSKRQTINKLQLHRSQTQQQFRKRAVTTDVSQVKELQTNAQSLESMLQHSVQQLRSEINKISLRTNNLRLDLEKVTKKERLFNTMSTEIKSQEHLFKIEQHNFITEVNRVNEKADQIRENKETILHNIKMKTKIPKNEYVQGLLHYEDLRNKHEHQEKIKVSLLQKEKELQIQKQKSLEIAQKARTLLIMRTQLYGWSEAFIKFKVIMPKTPMFIFMLGIIKVLMQKQIDDIPTEREDIIKMMDQLYPEGPNKLVDELIEHHKTLNGQINILMVDSESFNKLRNEKLQHLRTLENFEINDQIHEPQSVRLDLGELSYLGNQNQAKNLNSMTSVRVFTEGMLKYDSLALRIFYSFFEKLIKLLRMIDSTHTKFLRLRQANPGQLIAIHEQMQFVFWVKDQLCHNQEIKLQGPLVEVFCDEHTLFLSEDPITQLSQVQEIAHMKYRNILEQMFEQVNHLIISLRRPNVHDKIDFFRDSSSYKKLWDTQRMISLKLEDLGKYQEQLQFKGPKRTQSTQNRIVNFANEMQLNQIRTLKSSIIIEKRKKQAYKLQLSMRRSKEREKTLEIEDGELLFLNKTQSAIKSQLTNRTNESTIQEDQNIVDQINTLRSIQHNRQVDGRLWSNQMTFTERSDLQTVLTTQSSLMNMMIKFQNGHRLTHEKRNNLKRFLMDFRNHTLSHQKEEKVERLKEPEQRKSFIVFTRRSDYMRQASTRQESNNSN